MSAFWRKSLRKQIILFTRDNVAKQTYLQTKNIKLVFRRKCFLFSKILNSFRLSDTSISKIFISPRCFEPILGNLVYMLKRSEFFIKYQKQICISTKNLLPNVMSGIFWIHHSASRSSFYCYCYLNVFFIQSLN